MPRSSGPPQAARCPQLAVRPGRAFRPALRTPSATGPASPRSGSGAWSAGPASIGPVERNRGTHVEIRRAGSQPSARGPADWFTGTVRLDPLFSAPDPARAGAALVTFEPGARTAWHTHPLGQTLIVTAGCGWVQRDKGAVEEIRPGDVVWFPPNEKHWHGASDTTAMSHVAIQERLDGSPVHWMEHVDDAQYRR